MAEDRKRPGNTPVEQQERSPKDVEKTPAGRLSISGPGASDFLTAQGGADFPGAGGTKGMGAARQDDGPLGEGGRRAMPRLADDPNGIPGERDRHERLTGSQTGTAGGGGADAHNPAPVRATGVDDPTVSEAQAGAQHDGDNEEDQER